MPGTDTTGILSASGGTGSSDAAPTGSPPDGCTVPEPAARSGAEAPPAVDVRHVAKRFGGVQALDDVSVTIRAGQVLGLAGQNGAGKSTLVNVLAGMVVPDRGEVWVHGAPAPLGHPRAMGEAGIAVVSQEQALVPTMTVWENVFLGTEQVHRRTALTDRRAMRRRTGALLEELGVGGIRPTAVVADLPFASRQLVEIARAIHRAQGRSRPVVVLDEPTSGLSPREVEVLFSVVQRATGSTTFVFVSHVLADMLRLCHQVVVLTNGRVVADRPVGDITEATLHELMVGRSRRDDFYAVGRQRGTGAPASPRADDGPGAVPASTTERRSTSAALALQEVSVPGSCTDVSLHVDAGEVLGLAGIVGSGVSEVAAVIAGAVRPSRGHVVVAGQERAPWTVRQARRLGVHYVPPERRRDALFGPSSVGDNIAIAFVDDLRHRWTGLIDVSRAADLVRRLVERVQLRPPEPHRMIGELSGGNQQKAVFARLVGATCTVAVLDNPTRGVDVATREEIYSLIRDLADAGAAVVVTSESLPELIGLSDRLLVLRAGRISAELACPAEAKPSEVDVLAAL